MFKFIKKLFVKKPTKIAGNWWDGVKRWWNG